MARITHVKRAQQRYETMPVLDASGNPKRTPVLVDGVQKVSKKGPVWMAVTTNDLTRPKPNYMCDVCGKPIEVGTPYKHITPKSGPYGGTKRTRHEEHPDWQVWEYSSSLSARIAGIVHEANEELSSVESADDAQQVVDGAKDSIMELVEEKREAAQNIEDGFGHETSQSSELSELAESLESWADEADSIEIEDAPDEDQEEEITCEVCNGEGEVDNEDGSATVTCTECEGNGYVENPDYDPDAGTFEEWKDSLVEAITGWLDNSPA